MSRTDDETTHEPGARPADAEGPEPRWRPRKHLIIPKGIGEARGMLNKRDPSWRRREIEDLGVLQDWLPIKKRVREVCRNLGIRDRAELSHSGSIQGGIRGYFTDLTALGGTLAFLGDESDERAVREELSDEYHVVRDFQLSVPVAKDDYGGGAVNFQRPSASKWPALSGIPKAHDEGNRGKGILIGVLDTGIDADHAEFQNQVVQYRYIPPGPQSSAAPARDVRGFDTAGHGTRVCGILCGQTIGIAPEAELFVASVIESESMRTSLTRVAAGLDWLFKQFARIDPERPAVVNLSLGFSPVTDADRKVLAARKDGLREALKLLIEWNALPIVAIGNNGSGDVDYPGALDEVLGVGAADFNGGMYRWSSYGKPAGAPRSKPDLVGYGVGVESSSERDCAGRSGYRLDSGTSMAAPYAAGIAALYRSRDGGMGVQEVWDQLQQTAHKLGAPPEEQGAGLARFV